MTAEIKGDEGGREGQGKNRRMGEGGRRDESGEGNRQSWSGEIDGEREGLWGTGKDTGRRGRIEFKKWKQTETVKREIFHSQLNSNPSGNRQLLGQTNVGTVSDFFLPSAYLTRVRYVTTWTNLCTVRLEPEISGTYNPGRYKYKSIIPYCTHLVSFPVRPLWVVLPDLNIITDSLN